MGCYCLSSNFNSINSAIRKDLRPLWSSSGLPVCDYYLFDWFICSRCCSLNESAHHLSCIPRFRCRRIDVADICDHRRCCLTSRTWSLPGLLWCGLGSCNCCWSASRWILLRSRKGTWTNWLALDFLHQPSFWNYCSCRNFSGASYS